MSESNPRAVIGGNGPPAEAKPAPATRAMATPIDLKTDAVASTLWGALCGLEVDLGGDLRAVGMTLDKTLDQFLQSIASTEGEKVAADFARRLRKTLNGYIKDLEAV